MNLFPATQQSQEAAEPVFKLSYEQPHAASRIAQQLLTHIGQVPSNQEIVFVCIGTDRSTGDSLGPLIGSRLRKYNFSDIALYGTLEEPVHAMNLAETMQRIHTIHHQPFLVGIDACLGQVSSVGSVQIGKGPLKPGAGVKKELPEVGDIHLTGVVNVGGFMEYFVLQNTRLHLVVSMAEVMAKAIYMSLLQANRIAIFGSRERPGSAPILSMREI